MPMALSTITSNIDSILGLSLAVTPSNREESPVLSLGYDKTQSTCEIIVGPPGGFVYRKAKGLFPGSIGTAI